ncbi:hypothetical protein BDF20DRAFT_814435 [Mycotypha africana]|uniref:uncharacterized protein n=1 Tax=Mycotypha africana TaxID=64632 RepID=UPI0022FFDF72|nr:uncharacterized protein BDF20DRAFT_814435 [Mycotypha africana]KAI8987366.1 hypothetical protein BDF20DRAFT_814435 [Mycotypha africana]
MSTEGITNIQYVYTVWQTLNRTEPTINNIVFDGHTAVIHLTQNISPCIFPSFIHFQVPSITTLHFRETAGIPSPPPYDHSYREGGEGGIIKIYKQEDSWTLEGLLQSVPLISYWYNHILRLLMGKIVTATGDLLDAAIQQAERLTIRGQEIQQMGRNMAIDNIEKIEEYRTDLQENYIRGLKQWRLQQEQQQQLLLTEPEERSLLLDDIHMNCNKEGHLEGCPCQQQHQLGQLLPTLPYTDSDATSSRFRSEESIDYQYRSGRGLFR